jgi:hypothetical protein
MQPEDIAQPLPLVVITVPADVLAQLPEEDRWFATETEKYLMVSEEDFR